MLDKKCKFCNAPMEFDHSEGHGYSETHEYYCPMCGAVATVHENGEENTWEICNVTDSEDILAHDPKHCATCNSYFDSDEEPDPCYDCPNNPR